MTWILDEDYALKQKLSGHTLINYANGQLLPIATYFRFPDPEIRTRTFPHVAIDLTEVVFDAERAHRSGGFTLPFDTETATPQVGGSLVADDYPLPWSLIYQLACYSRQPEHDRQMMLWMYQAFPEQYGVLNMTAFDGTLRRADLVSSVRRDTVDANNKRLYRNIVTVAISSEFFLNQLTAIQNVAVNGLRLTVTPYVGTPV
jgi:hypothetical protein